MPGSSCSALSGGSGGRPGRSSPARSSCTPGPTTWFRLPTTRKCSGTAGCPPRRSSRSATTTGWPTRSHCGRCWRLVRGPPEAPPHDRPQATASVLLVLFCLHDLDLFGVNDFDPGSLLLEDHLPFHPNGLVLEVDGRIVHARLLELRRPDLGDDDAQVLLVPEIFLGVQVDFAPLLQAVLGRLHKHLDGDFLTHLLDGLNGRERFGVPGIGLDHDKPAADQGQYGRNAHAIDLHEGTISSVLSLVRLADEEQRLPKSLD